MKVFIYAEDGIVREEEMDIDLDPTNPGRASCVWGGRLIACDRTYLIEWALNVEKKVNLPPRERCLKDTIRGLRKVRKNIRMLQEELDKSKKNSKV